MCQRFEYKTKVNIMKNIYQESIQAVENGTKFKVDFKTRSFKLNGQYIIQNSQYEGDLGVELCASLDEFLSNVEHLYTRYKHSIPSTMSECKSRKYFKALSDKDLEDEDMLFGVGLRYSTSRIGIIHSLSNNIGYRLGC